MRVKLENVRVPKDNMIWPGRGFEISQVAWALAGSTTACVIGSAEKAWNCLQKRATQLRGLRSAAYKLGANIDVIADARMNISRACLLTPKTAWMMDHTSPKEALAGSR